ncbi:protein TIC [Forsythia ovata]|uniref:Protein TIC n=1 Tax=Forsythia ovata TaxID=205694 RepID=A0ABD1U7E5_9LAMI
MKERAHGSLVDAMWLPIRIAGVALIFAAVAAVTAGYGLGFWFGRSRNAGLGSAVALGAAGAGAAYALNSCVPEVAIANLYNGVVAGVASFIGNLVDLGDRLAVEIYNPNQDFWELCPPLPANFRPFGSIGGTLVDIPLVVGTPFVPRLWCGSGGCAFTNGPRFLSSTDLFSSVDRPRSEPQAID